ncbi:MAG: hypothetical protein U5Q16_15545 [Gammaproteobacteria bacterium]|nr:hypothetical protein [Gammaproteobacteria bacterium]
MAVQRWICGVFGWCCAAASLAAAPSIDVVGLSLSQGGEADGLLTDVTRVELRVTIPGETILGLADGSLIEHMRDDTGKVLIGPDVTTAAEAAAAIPGPPGMRATSSLEGSIRRDAVSVAPGGQDMFISVVAPLLPAADASRVEVDGTLVVNVVGEGERVVTLTDVDLDDDWGSDLEVDGQRLSCRLDESSGSGAERVSGFYCYGNQVDVLRIVARGSESVAIASADGRPNLAVRGETTGLTLDFMLPRPEPVEVLVQAEFGIGL